MSILELVKMLEMYGNMSRMQAVFVLDIPRHPAILLPGNHEINERRESKQDMSYLWLLVIGYILCDWLIAIWRGLAARGKAIPNFSLVEEPFVSILIPAWKERTVLAATLQGLRESTYPNWEAIVIAGGPDGTEEYARELCLNRTNFLVIPQPPRGKNAAFNLGLARAKGDILVLLDADTVVSPEWLSHLVAPITHGYDGATANYSPSILTWVSTSFEMEKISAYSIHQSSSLHGGGFAIRRKLVEQLGGFPEAVRVGVDWDFDQRVTALGARKIFVPQAQHQTPLSYTIRGYFQDELRWRRAHLQAIFRFFDFHQALGLRFYVVALLFFTIPLLAAFSWPELWPIFWIWILFRRGSLALEIAAFTGDMIWLRNVWIPVALIVIDFAAALAALLTVSKRQNFFQGPRPKGGDVL